MSKPHLTAIARKKPSLPMRDLSAKGLLVGRMLDYGCGKGMDANTYGMDKYDPHYNPSTPIGSYDTITCNYVLNVIEDPLERLKVLVRIKRLLGPGGRAYVTVRDDKASLKGPTSRGTWQGKIVLDYPIVHRKSGQYVIYEIVR